MISEAYVYIKRGQVFNLLFSKWNSLVFSLPAHEINALLFLSQKGSTRNSWLHIEWQVWVLFSSDVRPSFFGICFALNTHIQWKFIIMICMWVIGPVSSNKLFCDCSGLRGNIKLYHAMSVVVPSSWCFSCLYFCSVPKTLKSLAG